MMWPGGEFGYRKNLLPTFVQPWNPAWNWTLRVDTVISWILNADMPVNLAMLYIEEPDMHAHAFGPDSPEVANQIQKLDTLVGYLIQQLKDKQLSESVDVFLVSDHGMATTEEKNIIDLSTFTNQTMYKKVGTSPVIHVFPKEG